MTPPDFSVLLLAWDDADPSVAVLGGAALPPTLPLVYQLAARQPVVAVFPHLPAGTASAAPSQAAPETTASIEPKTDATTAATAAPEAPEALEAAKRAFDTTVALPGVQLLPGQAASQESAASSRPSRIIGLADLTPAGSSLLAVSAQLSGGASPAAQPPAASRSQWPTGANSPAASRPWQAPAAPYLGAQAIQVFPPPPPAPPRPGTAESAADTPVITAGQTIQPRSHPQAGDLNFDPDPELPALRRPAIFDEPTEAIGSAEALDLAAPEDDLVPDAPVPAAAALVAAVAPEPAPAPIAEVAPVVLVPALEGLNFRMIQYARQAAQLVRGRADFGVIYAPSWPAWLAALEIRNSSGRPLVLYAAGLAADLPNPAERGWQLEIERMTMRRARLILVPTEVLRRRLLALYGSTISEVRVIAAANEPAVQQVLREVTAG
ncbi:glycosyltransferase family 4 protein [Hymenobacter antarcticus]